MNVYLDEAQSKPLRGDLIAQYVQRSDLTPMPRSLEMVVRLMDGVDQKLKEGAPLWAGYEMLKYRIVKVERVPGAEVQGRDETGAIRVYALLDACAEIAFRRSRAVIRANASIGELYRACGAQTAIGDDVMVRRFACLVGEVPSFAMAQVMQEEGVVLVLSDKRLHLKRVADLFRQKPVQIIEQGDIGGVESEFMERHEIPAFFSTAPSGAIVHGDLSKTRAVAFQPRSDARVLYNMSHVLVTRHVVKSNLAQQIVAGDAIQAGDKLYAVITAANAFVEAGGGARDTYTKLWVGEVSQ